MPGFILTKQTRRDFIKYTVSALGTVAALDMRGFAADAKSSIHWALLSDIHIPFEYGHGHRNQTPHEHLEKVLPQVLKAQPEGMIITGDLARLEGKSEDYAELKRLLQPVAEKMPIGMCMGNHDDRNNFRQHFTELQGDVQSVRNNHVTVVETEAVRLVLLDSLLYVNRVAGLLGQEQRNWLKDFLTQADDKPLLLFVHHTLDEGDGDLLDVDRMFEIITPHRQVKAVVYGHSHVYDYQTRDDIHLINLPAVGYNFRDIDPIGWVEARLNTEGGEFTLHAVAGNTEDDGKTTSLKWRG
ncbi:MAG: metallophosphoesterase family protein [bacterium]